MDFATIHIMAGAPGLPAGLHDAAHQVGAFRRLRGEGRLRGGRVGEPLVKPRTGCAL